MINEMYSVFFLFCFRYVPELSQYPVEHIYEPWNAPLEVQKKAGCIVGKDYPARILEHNKTAKENIKKMEELKANLMKQLTQSKVRKSGKFLSPPKMGILNMGEIC